MERGRGVGQFPKRGCVSLFRPQRKKVTAFCALIPAFSQLGPDRSLPETWVPGPTSIVSRPFPSPQPPSQIARTTWRWGARSDTRNGIEKDLTRHRNLVTFFVVATAVPAPAPANQNDLWRARQLRTIRDVATSRTSPAASRPTNATSDEAPCKEAIPRTNQSSPTTKITIS
jgi:hypothetical protein